MKMPFRAALSALLAACLCATAVAQVPLVTPSPNRTGLPGAAAFGGEEWMDFRQNGVRVTAPVPTVIGQAISSNSSLTAQISALGGGGGLSASAVSALPASSALTGTEASPCVQSATLVQCTPAKQSAYTFGTGLTALPAASALTGAETSNAIQGGVPVKTTVAQIGGYALTTGVTGATAAGVLAGTESIPAVTAGGAQVKVTASQIAGLAGSVAGAGKPALTNMLRALASGQSQSLVLNSDSTSVQDVSSRWPFMTAYGVGQKYPNARIEFLQSNGGVAGSGTPMIQLQYLYYPMLVIQPGAAGERGVNFATTGTAQGRNIQSASIAAPVSNDLQILTRFSTAYDSTSKPTAVGTIEAQWAGVSGLAADKMQMVQQLTTGDIQLSFETASGANLYTANWSQAALGYVIGTPITVMFTVQADNGSSGNTVCAYVIGNLYKDASTGGNVSNTLTKGSCIAPTSSTFPAATVTYAGTTSADRTMEIGARTINVQPFFGTVYKAVVFDGIDGPMVNSPLIDDFGRPIGGAVSNTNSNTVGSPTLMWFNGGTAGKNLAWFMGAANAPLPQDNYRINRLIPPGAYLTALATGHNEGATGAAYKTALDQWYAAAANRSPGGTIWNVLENPEMNLGVDSSNNQITNYVGATTHAMRQRQVAAYSAYKGWPSTDILSAFTADPRWSPTSTTLMGTTANNLVHPSTPNNGATLAQTVASWPGTGYYLMAQIVLADLGLSGVLP